MFTPGKTYKLNNNKVYWCEKVYDAHTMPAYVPRYIPNGYPRAIPIDAPDCIRDIIREMNRQYEPRPAYDVGPGYKMIEKKSLKVCIVDTDPGDTNPIMMMKTKIHSIEEVEGPCTIADRYARKLEKERIAMEKSMEVSRLERKKENVKRLRKELEEAEKELESQNVKVKRCESDHI